MKIRYFTKGGSIWIDFKLPDGSRKRMTTGVPEGQDKVAEKAAAGVVSKALAAFAVPKDPAPATVTASAIVSGWTFKAAYTEGLRTEWLQAKDRAGLEDRYNAVVAQFGEDTDLGVVTRDGVLSWREAMMKAPGKRPGSTLSASTINQRLSMLSMLLKLANLPGHNVKQLSVVNNGRKRRIRGGELEAVHAWLLAHAVDRKGAADFSDLITVGLNTAARQSELLGLLWADVYFDRNVVVFRDPKNGTHREGWLNDTATAVLERRKGNGLPGPFSMLHKDRCTDLWAQARKALGLEHDHEFVFHVATRHEGISRAAETGANTFLIQSLSGHKSIQAAARYAKPVAQAMRQLGAAIENYKPGE